MYAFFLTEVTKERDNVIGFMLCNHCANTCSQCWSILHYSSSEIAWSLSYLRNQLALLLIWVILLLNYCVCIKLDVEEVKQVDTHWVMRLSRNIKKFPHFLSTVQQIFRIKHRSCQTILCSHVIKMIQPFKKVTGPVLKCKFHLLVSYLFPLPKWYWKGKILKSIFSAHCLHLRTQV